MSKQKIIIGALVVAVVGGVGFSHYKKKQARLALQKKNTELSMFFDRTHLVAFGELRDLPAVRKVFNLPQSKGLQACLKAKGKKCKSFAQAPQNWSGPQGAHEGNFTILGGRCETANLDTCVVKRTAQIKLLCASDKECSGAQAMLNSEYVGDPQLKIKSRRSLMSVSAQELLSK